ncbi:MAG TPA: hypothetical protein PKC30_04410 [Saprospiraceae bacterium]|nr:hypothetical protein [Saprospiraceae bacterium]
MINSYREQFNAAFTEEKYQQFLGEIASTYQHKPLFRISETPVFVDHTMKSKLLDACDHINQVVTAHDFKERTQRFIRPEYFTPGEGQHNLFMQYDFGICVDENGSLVPKLIEIQGFPTLYFYQDFVAQMYRKHFPIPDTASHLFNGLDSGSYKDLLKKMILGNEDPKHVILLEIEPETQPTRIDYLCTSQALGIKTVCITELKKSGRELYYIDEGGKKVKVHRIYNRIIFDELVGRKDLNREFYFSEEVDVQWAGHPNYFFRISKSTLPFIDSPYVPNTRFLSDVENLPDDLENYVLKPLYSFSGTGVVFNVRPEHIEVVKDRDNYILQEKVHYAPAIKGLDGFIKCEIRMIFVWEEDAQQPILVNNLARLSRGEMIGVKYNKDKTWVGGSIGFFEK